MHGCGCFIAAATDCSQSNAHSADGDVVPKAKKEKKAKDEPEANGAAASEDKKEKKKKKKDVEEKGKAMEDEVSRLKGKWRSGVSMCGSHMLRGSRHLLLVGA